MPYHQDATRTQLAAALLKVRHAADDIYSERVPMAPAMTVLSTTHDCSSAALRLSHASTTRGACVLCLLLSASALAADRDFIGTQAGRTTRIGRFKFRQRAEDATPMRVCMATA